MSEARRLLFLAPIAPSDRGNGLAMRCGVLLDAYARSFVVDLAVVPVVALDVTLDAFALRRARRAQVFAPSRPDSHFALIERIRDDAARLDAFARYGKPALTSRLTEELRAALARWCGAETYQFVHVSRLYLAELAAPWLITPERHARCVIDCDEDDALAFRRVARMHERTGDNVGAAWARLESSAFARHAGAWLPRFDCILAAAPGESRSLAQRAGQTLVLTVPNTIAIAPLRRAPAPGQARRKARTIIFVGNMGYVPNADAVAWFAKRVWPRLRRRFPIPLRLVVVGANPPPSVARLDRRAGITVTGAVADVAPYYAAADLAIVPVRGGGGTRIKLLEAAERGVPLVATAFGAAGTRLRNGIELAIAEDATAFIRACAALLDHPRRAAAMAARARRRVRLDYDASAWAARLIGLIGGDRPGVDDSDVAAC
jgi:polysaccharide biosynthesis protein PslH